MSTTASLSRLGVLAGGGPAPRRLLQFLRDARRPYYVVCLQGQADDDLGAGEAHCWLPLGAGERLAQVLRDESVTDIVMIGKVRRPSLHELRPDAFTLKKLLQIGFAMLGDDGLLRAVTRLVEAEGFRVVGIQDITQDFLMPEGQLSAAKPTEQDWHDIRRGAAVARQLGLADTGQSVVVQQGMVLGVEAIEGTDALIARCGALKREGGGGVLVKLCKPQQDRRLDLPSIGSGTIAALHAAGLAGVAAEAGKSLCFDRALTVRDADAAGLFLLGFMPDGAAREST